MEEVNKNTELDNTDKKLHISDYLLAKVFILLGNYLVLHTQNLESL